ncbi:hypothetical protein O181_075396 [Austropuccinia psidii MF-1]|uniref:Uncharacterized protein n=1 Tax=Austropuccinia psidii MF-1 TaxID=1389203 RepID=A0A9Q3F8G8_9BASI|nr:hypothetical protein [Austropuccinia psidii MF-1]
MKDILVEAPQASTRKNPPQRVPNKGNKSQKGDQKGKKKAKENCNTPYPRNHRIPKKQKTAMKNVFNIARTMMEFKNKEVERMNQSFTKK